MNKAQLIRFISEKTGFDKKQTEIFMETFTDSVTETLLSGEKVSISGFGTFEVRERAKKEAYNPVTKKTVTVPAKKAPAFKASKSFKEAVAKVK